MSSFVILQKFDFFFAHKVRFFAHEENQCLQVGEKNDSIECSKEQLLSCFGFSKQSKNSCEKKQKEKVAHNTE